MRSNDVTSRMALWRSGVLAALSLALFAVPAVALAQEGASVVVAIDGQNQITPDTPGGLLYTYLGLVLKWASGLIGALLLCFLVYYGFVLMFSGVSDDQVKHAKEGLMATLGGVILFLTSGLVLYTLNPVFFCGFGGGGCGGTVMGEPGPGGETPPTSGTPPVSRPPSSIAPSTSCSPEVRATCNIPGDIKNLAASLRSNSNITFVNAGSIGGDGSASNIADIASGSCPVVQLGPDSNACGNSGSSTCETRMDVLKKYVPNMTRSLGGLQRIANAGVKISISALYGNKHSCATHRQFRAYDINYVNGIRVRNMSARQACDAARLLQVSGAPKVIGPRSMGTLCGGGGIIADTSGVHDNHFHLEWGSGGGMSGFAAGIEEEDPVDMFEEGPIE